MRLSIEEISNMPYDAKHPPKAMTIARFTELYNATDNPDVGQKFFIDRVASLDKYYEADRANKGGMCSGISAVARDYFLIGRFDDFSKLMLIINAIPVDHFAEELEAMLQLGLAEKNQLVLATYNSIQLIMGRTGIYQSISKFSDLILDAPFYQPNDIWSRVQPFTHSIDTEGNVLPAEPIASFSAAYSKEDLVSCLKILQSNLHNNCSFKIVGLKHAMVLNYSPEGGWVLVNPDRLPSRSYATIEDLAEILIFDLTDQSVDALDIKTIVFNSELYTTQGNSSDTAAQWQMLTSSPAWKDLQRITPEKALLKDIYGTNLLQTAVIRGDFNTVRESLALVVAHEEIAPTAQELKDNILHAALRGYAAIVGELSKYRPALKDWEIYILANDNRQEAVINELIKDETDEYCNSLIENLLTFKPFIVSCVLKNRPLVNAEKAFMMAVRYEKTEIARAILEQRPDMECTMALEEAVRMGITPLVRELIKARPQLDRKEALKLAIIFDRPDMAQTLLIQSTISVEDIQVILSAEESVNSAVSVVQEHLSRIKPPAHVTEEDEDKKEDEIAHRFGP